jgi:hypothetical protein
LAPLSEGEKELKVNIDDPIFSITTYAGHKYVIYPSGMVEGFSEAEGIIVVNKIGALLNYAKGLTKKALDNGLITTEQAAGFLP